jgi:AraC-like DNA-binding protein
MQHNGSSLVLHHQLGGYREFTPPAALAACCESVWLYRTPPVAEDAVHRVLPDLSLNIEFIYHRAASGEICDARLFASGSSTAPQLAGFSPGCEIAAVKMKLEWMSAALGVGPEDLQDSSIPLADLEPRLADAFMAGLSASETIEATTARLIATTARHMNRRQDRYQKSRRIAARALDVVRWTRGRCDVGYIASQMGCSARYLRRVVERDAHVSLKTYAQTVRLLHAITMADMLPAQRVSWAMVAVDAGYFDQSHLIRECRAICGLTPRDILRERRSETDDAPLQPMPVM